MQIYLGREEVHWPQRGRIGVALSLQCTQRVGSLLDGICHRKGH
jgi:hypothetical protein